MSDHAPEKRALSSTSGEKWDYDEGTQSVSKIVVGKLDDGEPIPFSRELIESIAAHWDGLTHLHFWRVEGVSDLLKRCGGRWPSGLITLDLRRCEDIASIPELPVGLEELVLVDCPKLESVSLPSTRLLPKLDDLSLNGCAAMSCANLSELWNVVPEVRKIDFSGCTELAELPQTLPAKLVDLRLNGCHNLVGLPKQWPEDLKRLEINGAAISTLPNFPAVLDYVDLRKTSNLHHLPEQLGSLRTLFIHGSGLELPNELFGDKDFNSAGRVHAHLGEPELVSDNEIKVILIGDGRAGKTSLARRLVEDKFDERESSTHGIKLWKTKLEFTPYEGGTATVSLNLWDFAGQDLYHNTHRLFFQSKAIFVICGNCCPGGACPETDGEEAAGFQADIQRRIRYWSDQVKSLGSAPGMDGSPPMVIVRTKADRDNEDPSYKQRFLAECGDVLNGETLIELGAKPDDDKGVQELIEWIQAQAKRVLGARGRREIGSRPLRVKRELEILMGENDTVHCANDKVMAENEERKTRGEAHVALARPPYPKMSREEFHTMTKAHCPAGAYFDEPDLLLSRLHLSGFLYHDPKFLPEVVILDQRWAIDGIYAAFDRESTWPAIEENRGRFRPKLLAALVWDDLKYLPDDQAVFLRFMESCGLAFALESEGGLDSEYVLPAALPSWADKPEVRRSASAYLGGTQLSREPLALSLPFLSRDAMMELLIRLGRGWRRAMEIWRWGGQIESFRNWDTKVLADSNERTFIRLNWSENSPGSYGGTMTVSLYGKDESLLAAVLNECRTIGAFEEVDIPSIELTPEPEREGHLETSKLPSADRGSMDGHKSEAVVSNLVTIGISFKGDAGQVESIDDLPEDSVERWPLALSAALKGGQYGFKVEEYRTEQDRPSYEKFQSRKAYLDSLTSKEFMVAFLSWDYLESPWCMYEFLKIFKRMGSNELDPEVAQIFSFKEALISQSNLKQRHPKDETKSPRKFLKDYWQNQYQEFIELINSNRSADEADPLKIKRNIETEVSNFAYDEWMSCVEDENELDAILTAISGNWAIHGVDRNPSVEAPEKWAAEIFENTQRGDVLMRYGAVVFTTARNRGLRLFTRGFLREDPDGQPDGLLEVLSKNPQHELAEFKEMREALLGIVVGSSGAILTYDQLDAELKERESLEK